MASFRNLQSRTFTAEEVAEICARDESDADSDIDSSVGGISSGEEFDLDNELQQRSDSDSGRSIDDNEDTVSPSEDKSDDSENNSDDVDESDPVAASRGKRKRPSTGRGRGCSRARGRGRGRGQGRGRAQRVNNVANDNFKSYDDPDTGNQLPSFSPSRPPGFHLNFVTRGTMTKAIDFFKLFFTQALILEICTNTNLYAWREIGNKPSYGDKYGAWIETTPQEIERMIALIIYCGLVNVSSFQRYWSVKTLYHGLWARNIMTRLRFKALMGMLHVVDPQTENEKDKLRKVVGFLTTIKDKCKSLYQPYQHVAVDERMVKSKHRSGMRQYIKDKPTKWGIKLWVLADSANGYTYDFDVYTGKNAAVQPSEHGLGYDVVMRLVQPLINQGYHVYFDNFYTSPTLVKNLFDLKLPSCGTAAENRKSFPDCMKKGKVWAKEKERGTMRWERDGKYLAQQWIDNRPVTMLTTIHTATEFVMVDRKGKVGDRWQNLNIRQPKSIADYNKFMNGVDRSDQIISKNTSLRKCMRWWKTLFFHMIDIAVVNSFILFQLHRAKNPDNPDLQRPKKFATTEFREELVRQLAGLEDYGEPPVFKTGANKQPAKEPGSFETVHIPQFSDVKRNCRVCYQATKKELKVISYCSAPQCQVYLHCTQKNNCFAVWHSKEFDHGK